ncbi:unnamed protein product [Arabis nemorensis]|uniref:Uncharacterized protein n=1 Tax=Arabis nemorensis TaxID=586526 RepID=A0A565C5T1_9BRAS|nr:unnamed protein product [Arabis nemorensis]
MPLLVERWVVLPPPEPPPLALPLDLLETGPTFVGYPSEKLLGHHGLGNQRPSLSVSMESSEFPIVLSLGQTTQSPAKPPDLHQLLRRFQTLDLSSVSGSIRFFTVSGDRSLNPSPGGCFSTFPSWFSFADPSARRILFSHNDCKPYRPPNPVQFWAWPKLRYGPLSPNLPSPTKPHS